MKIKKLLKIGIINTIRLNFHYFGWGGVLQPRILASKRLKIARMKGAICAPKMMGCIQIGVNDIGIFDRKYERCIWDNSGKIVFNGKTTLGQGVRISNCGNLVFGDNVCIQANSTIVCQCSVIISDNALISWEVLIMDTDFHKIYNKDDEKVQINPPKEITIGEHVWIGCRCLILKGTRIPSNSIIAANSTVSKEYDNEYTIISTNKILKNNMDWEA